MTPGQHVPYTLGYTRDTMGITTGRNAVKGGANPYKDTLSLD